ncbi:TetR/AcrR family transcriptional regulator [Sodalis ligni]|uniref:TetR family transcriptional regulator n=1 Tax=Sodalis ligni TaxID=2697027 RepID=A0A4R1N7S7_9GAMM|nr:TetR/AcrR family transcriptional regulator [Sodalis ligni]TCL03232.1 TetR family transcriptional regulator [Sodalis ligni]
MTIANNKPPISDKQHIIDERRDRIIAAARICFRQHGFHGAGMAEIAALSHLSVGQIYRYFTNKESIIEEVVHRIVKQRVRLMLDNDNDLDRIADDLAGNSLWGGGGEEHINQVLMLEVAAEATRNPRIAQILADEDAELFQEGCTMLLQIYPEMKYDEAARLAELLAVLSEGTTLRVLTRQQHGKHGELQKIYRQIFATVFPTRLKTGSD